MELTETEKYLISGLKLQKVSKGKLAAICLMLETEKQQMKMIQYIAEHEDATDDDLMRLARRIAET